MIFYTLYMGLRKFEIGVDNGHKYVYQAIDKQDKNHVYDEINPANQAKMYEQPGNLISQ